jgi:hypothetical protein
MLSAPSATSLPGSNFLDYRAAIPQESGRPEDELSSALFEAKRPLILGALFDTCRRVLGDPPARQASACSHAR